jgi:hypothetical protein
MIDFRHYWDRMNKWLPPPPPLVWIVIFTVALVIDLWMCRSW